MLFNKQNFTLTYLDRYDIECKESGLTEPSGLTLSHGKKALWTISDDTKKIFKLSRDGKLKEHDSFEILDMGLEGITLDPGGTYLFVVKEETNEVIQIQIGIRQVVARKPLADMTRYDTVEHYFNNSQFNKGLEGIAWNSKTGTIFVMKEGVPGLLIEISSDLKEILSHQLLNNENGFGDMEVSEEKLDFSDLCYDQQRDRFWIISDTARKLFLYDWNSNSVIQSSKLGYGVKGEYREIEKSEGVSIDSDANRLYVVSDAEVRLYVFDVRDC